MEISLDVYMIMNNYLPALNLNDSLAANRLEAIIQINDIRLFATKPDLN